MKDPKVLVVLRADRQLPPGLVELVSDRAELRYAVHPEELTPDSRDADVLFVWDFRNPFLPRALHELPNLRWAHVAAVGVDACVSEEVRASQITMTNSSGVTATQMAEYALGLILAIDKGLVGKVRDQQAKVWRPTETGRLQGRKLLLFGVGAVNRHLAIVARALQMHVIGVGRSARPAFGGFDLVIGSETIDEVLPEADYVVLAAPATQETRGIFDRNRIGLMKPEVILVNVGRGALIDQDALVDALQTGRIRGAGLDVFAEEPLPNDSPLWGMKNVLISPHMSSDFVGWKEALVERFVENLDRWINDEELLSIVDLDLGYAPSGSTHV